MLLRQENVSLDVCVRYQGFLQGERGKKMWQKFMNKDEESKLHILYNGSHILWKIIDRIWRHKG